MMYKMKTAEQQQMRAVLIDPFDKTVTEVDIKDTGLDSILNSIRELVLGSKQEGFLTHVRGPEVLVWLDDEGLFKSNQHYFRWKWHLSNLGGKAVVMGYTPEGDDRDCPMSLADVRDAVRFFKIQPVFSELETTEEQGEFHGQPATIIKREAQWKVEGELE